MSDEAKHTDPLQKILLIESNLSMLELYERELSRHFRVFAFSDVEGALDVIDEGEISAVVLESELPSRQGWELLKSIKQASSVPVILFNTIDSRKKALEAKADVYLLKPVTPFELIDTLLQICDNGKQSLSQKERVHGK